MALAYLVLCCSNNVIQTKYVENKTVALINQQQSFNPDLIVGNVVGIAAEVGRHDSGMHSHAKGQLLYAPRGCMRIVLDGQRCVLPPTRAAWIPAGVQHQAMMTNVVSYRSVYFSIEVSQLLGQEVKVVVVNELLRALIERMAWWPWDITDVNTHNTLALFIEEMQQAERESLQLTLPLHSRLKALVERWSPEGELPPALIPLAGQFGASAKTVSRIFCRETGMSYQAWRQQWRLLAAIELLSMQRQVNDVAYLLGFSSDSAFIHFFRQHTGMTPLKYMHGQWEAEPGRSTVDIA